MNGNRNQVNEQKTQTCHTQRKRWHYKGLVNLKISEPFFRTTPPILTTPLLWEKFEPPFFGGDFENHEFEIKLISKVFFNTGKFFQNRMLLKTEYSSKVILKECSITGQKFENKLVLK